MTKIARPIAAATSFLKARPRAVGRTALLGIVVASLVSVPGLATAATAPSPPPKASPSQAVNAAAVLGVTVSSGGWINYSKLVSKTLPLTNVKTLTITGTRGADGGCLFGSPPPTASAGKLDYTEQIALNPTSCSVKFLTGQLSETAATKFKAQIQAQSPSGTAAASSPTMAASGPSAKATAGGATAPAAAPGKYALAAAYSPTYYNSAYTMSRWIDPVAIVITAQAINLRWPLYGKGGTLTASWPTYAFKYDGWSKTGPNFSGFSTLAGNTGWSVAASTHYVNRDFATVVYALMGLAGWFACGMKFTNKADFHHYVRTVGYRKGTMGYNASNSASGACANLVHLQTLHGYGTWK